MIALAAFSVAGCASDVISGVTKGVLDKVFEKGPPKIKADLVAAAGLNPDPQGRPSPLVVRIYQLKSLSVFDNADFFALYEKDTTLLGDDLVGRDEIEFVPGETKTYERELKPEVRYLGILAAYRDIEKARWRASVETPIDTTTEVVVKLGPLGVMVTPKE